MKTLYLDIECSPNLGDLWGLFNQNVSLAQLRETSRVICWSAKFRGERTTYFQSEFHSDRVTMLREAYDLVEQADIVCGYNTKSFDMPTLNRDWWLQGWTEPAPYQDLDLYREFKRRFRFASHKLDHIAQQLGLGGKYKHEGHMLWVKCLAGDPKAWERMKRYCIRDTKLLEPAHTKAMGWITGPNLRLYDETDGCPQCGSKHLTPQGHRYTAVAAFPRWKCKDCGKWSTSTKRAFGTDVRSI